MDSFKKKYWIPDTSFEFTRFTAHNASMNIFYKADDSPLLMEMFFLGIPVRCSQPLLRIIPYTLILRLNLSPLKFNNESFPRILHV